MANGMNPFFDGFSKLNREQRFARLIQMGALTQDDVKFLKTSAGLNPDLAENLIENVIGYHQMPLGVATNFNVDGKDVVIPMAVEETSIIAAASKTAKWIRKSGKLTTETEGNLIIGQIQIRQVKNYETFKTQIEKNKHFLIESSNTEVAFGLVRRGGGVIDIEVRKVSRADGKDMAIVHVLADPCDAMGANILNQVCEFLKEPIENLTKEKVGMCILSNLNDRKLTRARILIKNIDPELGSNIQEASYFAEQDPYRAATNNKGVLNGMDSVLLATGNDWRAVEAGVHSYAARDGQYRSITKWRMKGKHLEGTLEAPVIVGIVGGVTKIHPSARMCLRMLKVASANELSRIVAAVGLVQNLGAISALTTVGIIEGHMKLHIANLTISAGAKEKEIPLVQKRLEEILALRKRITLSNAIDVLKELRDKEFGKKKSQNKQAI